MNVWNSYASNQPSYLEATSMLLSDESVRKFGQAMSHIYDHNSIPVLHGAGQV